MIILLYCITDPVTGIIDIKGNWKYYFTITEHTFESDITILRGRIHNEQSGS
jgi:hypothetical protein